MTKKEKILQKNTSRDLEYITIYQVQRKARKLGGIQRKLAKPQSRGGVHQRCLSIQACSSCGAISALGMSGELTWQYTRRPCLHWFHTVFHYQSIEYRTILLFRRRQIDEVIWKSFSFPNTAPPFPSLGSKTLALLIRRQQQPQIATLTKNSLADQRDQALVTDISWRG